MKKLLVKNCAECGCQFVVKHGAEMYCSDCIRQRNKRYRHSYYQNKRNQKQNQNQAADTGINEIEVKIKIKDPVKFMKILQTVAE